MLQDNKAVYFYMSGTEHWPLCDNLLLLSEIRVVWRVFITHRHKRHG